jgi:nucleoid-associated protein YgaU
MGLFSFIKNAGAKVFGIGKTTAEEAADKAAVVAAEAKEKASKLVNAVETLGFEVLDLNVEVEGDNVTVWGQADSQATREKVVLVIGNTAGIATVDDRMTVEIEEPVAEFHTVVSGDYLSKIAKKYYGDAMKYPIIFEANKPMLADPDKIYPGQVLRIPVLD